MRIKHIIIVVVGLIVLALMAVLVVRLVPKQDPPVQVFTPTYYPTNGWQTNTPEEQGVDSLKLAKLLKTIQKNNLQVNSLIFVRNGVVILDAYFYNPYDGTFPHDMASVTKSIMTTLIGIAAGQGKIQLDQPILSYLPNRTIANLDSNKEQITVRHLTGMVNGFESGCMADDMGTLNQMRSNPDWIQAALDRKMVGEPGKKFCYDSPGMHLLSAILQESTGMTALEFAQKYLFEPMGIHDVIWESDPQGYTHGWGDIHLYPQDAAKIGYLFLNNGVWDGQQVVPADWVAQAVMPHVRAGADDYGYGWWVEKNSFGAMGRGGQNIVVFPSQNAIAVTTGGGFDYDQIAPLLTSIVSDSVNPLPPNPQGVAQLEEVLRNLVKDLPALPGIDTPRTAQEISGNTYIFETNPVMLKWARINFTDPTEMVMDLNLFGANTTWRIGLDGQYRYSPDGSLQRGYWKDAQTFMVEVFDVGLDTRQFTLTTNQMVVEASGMKILGTLENP